MILGPTEPLPAIAHESVRVAIRASWNALADSAVRATRCEQVNMGRLWVAVDLAPMQVKSHRRTSANDLEHSPEGVAVRDRGSSRSEALSAVDECRSLDDLRPYCAPPDEQTMKGIAHDQEGCGDDLVGNVEMSRQEFHAIACRFLGSDFTGQIYADWPVDLRLAPSTTGRSNHRTFAELWEIQPNG